MMGLLLYLIMINLIAFCAMGFDKSRARQGGRRIPEKRLFGLSAAGGALGTWIGMNVWRHKTKHASFVFGVPALLLLNAGAVYFLYHIVG